MSRGHQDRVAVITGGAGALGSHFACRLAAEGCHVAIADLAPFVELTLAEFRRFEAVNVEAALLLAQQFTPGMAERGFGRIVQITSSTTGSPMPGFAGYVITKMAGIGLVRALAAELFRAVRDRQLLKRTEVPEDLCGALVFLTSEEAAFITGQILNVDGGVVF